MTVPVPENVTDELVAVKLPEVTEDVSQLPVLIIMVEEANVITATPPEDVRLLAPNAIVPALVKVKVPDHVRLTPIVVFIPELTVKLFAVSSIDIVPPEALTTIVDVPTVYVPAVESKLVTVIVDPLAIRMPPAATVTVTALIARFAPDVSRTVVLPTSLTVNVEATSILRVAIVKV